MQVQQAIPEKQPAPRRSAARPSPALRVSSVPPSQRPGAQGVSIPSLEKSSAASSTSPVSQYAGRARVDDASTQVCPMPNGQLEAIVKASCVWCI